jgi:hypothetical protein
MILLTNKRRPVFSLSAPIQPAKQIIKMTAPVMMKNSAGSNEIFVNLPILLNMSFSDHAHNPIVRQTAPTS